MGNSQRGHPVGEDDDGKKLNFEKRGTLHLGSTHLVWSEYAEIVKWTNQDISEWLEAIGFQSLVTSIASLAPNGSVLVTLNLDDERFLQLFSEDSERDVFVGYVCHLKWKSGEMSLFESGFFSMKFHRVFRKVLRCVGPGCISRSRSLERCASILSDWRLIKRYLFEHKGVSDGCYRFDDESTKLRLIITDWELRASEVLSRKALSPVQARIRPHQGPVMGQFRSALAVGSFYLQWTDSELLLPIVMTDHGAFSLLFDTNPMVVDTHLDADDAMTKLAMLLENWNTDCLYALMPRRRNEMNSLDFLFAVCTELGFDLNLDVDTVYSQYVRKMKTQGIGEMIFQPSERFTEDFKLREWDESSSHVNDSGSVEISFGNHTQLDDFLYWCYMANWEAIRVHPDEYRLLKSFDRAFWLRHLEDPDDEAWRAAPVADETNRRFGCSSFLSGCPFADPRETG